ncbi:MAG: TetR/AcrR family transcriptional regulator [Bacteroidota bacterium]
MKNTKEKILDAAHELFNLHGVGEVSLRGIASHMGISHGNLRYHFPSKSLILEGLHQRILQAALEENQQVKGEDINLLSLKDSTERGFSILYDYRFFMIDLYRIMQENESLHQTFLEVEKVRAHMYKELILASVDHGLMRKEEYKGEYDELIVRIRIFSDFWISSAGIYDKLPEKELVRKYASLLMSMFYPYLTTAGKASNNR